MFIPCLDFGVKTKQITHDKDNTMKYVAMISKVGHGQENENHPGSLQATAKGWCHWIWGCSSAKW